MTNRDQSSAWIHRAALWAAFAAILLVAVGVPFWHTDAPGSADTCPICHVAHISALPGAPGQPLAAPVTVARLLLAEVLFPHTPPAAVNPPPRAPPV
jgi:hypothetical protein